MVKTKAQYAAALLGGAKRKEQRISQTEKIRLEAMQEVHEVHRDQFRLLGAMLYWAEGSKQKVHSISKGTIFSNSDPLMIVFFYKWLLEICQVSPGNITCELYIHRDANIQEARRFWAVTLKLPIHQLNQVRLKKGNPGSYRKNKGKGYHGVLRLTVRRSTNLNRTIMAWVERCINIVLPHNSEVV